MVQQWVAQLAGGQPFLQPGQHGRVPAHKAYPQADALLLCCSGHGAGVFQGQGHRFLAQHMLALPDGLPGHPGVQVGGHAHRNHIHFWQADGRMVVGVPFAQPILAGQRLCPLGQDVDRSNDFCLGQIIPALGMDVAHHAAANDADPQRLCVHKNLFDGLGSRRAYIAPAAKKVYPNNVRRYARLMVALSAALARVSSRS